jgi:hypothetical protein
MLADSRTIVVTMLIAAALAACARVPALNCASGLMPELQAELFFGRDVAGHPPVTEDLWQQFVDEEVTPRFPDGFSVSDIRGQWRDPAGRIVREQSKELLIVLPGRADDQTKLDAIRDAYKRRFNQESVLLVETPGCAAL